jgi:group I intron endonuclease
MIIYKAICVVTNKCYIGQTVKSLEKRKNEHLNGAAAGLDYHFYRALRAHGFENFEWTILAIPSSFGMMNTLEELYIEKFDSFVSGYNMTLGGSGSPGRICSEITKKKLSIAGIGKHHSEEAKQKMKKAAIGRTHTATTKQKIREAVLGENHPNYGKSRNDETKQKISKAQKGKSLTKKHKEKLRLAWKMRRLVPMSEETRAKIGKAQKGIKHPIVQCPHCSKSGGNRAMKQHHFDNCKFKNIEYV